MDKLTMGAFEKLQKREHLLRSMRNQRALGRITQEVFKEREAAILKKFKLTPEEERAIELHNQMIQQRKRNSK